MMFYMKFISIGQLMTVMTVLTDKDNACPDLDPNYLTMIIFLIFLKKLIL